ncbi:gamma-interferon-inducible lysosomal thiol reductase-like isoform X3 [Schistocerca serialis cubense]|uniref:gamma-interferon-inducible lysosomal thiol reductase-like isoform X2 n=1 Tax=Schistocerca serialis cubense TaxID=2023355 RepID=UPI00214EF6E6|nr:gamma-interferon-inducible lysosomal thiol reductase-like isoform X2 [Schistocerca serialis cubense]XP_049943950.1 gamma-interferon-inducible lysosomal thiol reductase-like isoform X3 [Schistocerca serialis cubense]
MFLPRGVLSAFGLAILFHAQVFADNTARVGVYYETLSPACREFFINQLIPTYKHAPERITVTLVPFGNTVVNSTNPPTFTCEHGETECEGLKIHSCAIALVQDQTTLLNLADCTIRNQTDPEAILTECATTLGIEWRPIADCAKSTNGSQLLKVNGDKTNALNPGVKELPIITLYGSQSEESQLRTNLWNGICKVLQPKPSTCQ